MMCAVLIVSRIDIIRWPTDRKGENMATDTLNTPVPTDSTDSTGNSGQEPQAHDDAIMRDLSRPRTPWQYLRITLTGMAMGAADSVPGVSGGTMAFILGIYETLINAIKSFDLKALQLAIKFDLRGLFAHIPFGFLIALGVGLLAVVIALSGIITGILDDPDGRVLLFAFFFGLIVASVIAVGQKVRWSPGANAMLAVGAVIAFAIVNIVPAEGSHDLPILFVSGMIAICAMILPGISGAFILLILGQYDYILTTLSDLVRERDFSNLPPLIVFGLGCVVGIIVFSRVLSWTLTHYYNTTIALLVGFMLGSLWKIWPFKECLLPGEDRHGDFVCLQESNILPADVTQLLIAAGLAFVGFVLVSLLDHLQSRDNAFIRLFTRRKAQPTASAGDA